MSIIFEALLSVAWTIYEINPCNGFVNALKYFDIFLLYCYFL